MLAKYMYMEGYGENDSNVLVSMSIRNTLDTDKRSESVKNT